MSCTCTSTHRGWIQPHLPEALWKEDVEPGSLVLAIDSMVCVRGLGLPENSACCVKVTLAAYEKHRIELNELFTCSACNSSSYCRKAFQPQSAASPTHGGLVPVSKAWPGQSWINDKGQLQHSAWRS